MQVLPQRRHKNEAINYIWLLLSQATPNFYPWFSFCLILSSTVAQGKLYYH